MSRSFKDEAKLPPGIAGRQFVDAGLRWATGYLTPLVVAGGWRSDNSGFREYGSKAAGEFLLFSWLIWRRKHSYTKEYESVRELRASLASQLRLLTDGATFSEEHWQMITCLMDHEELAKRSRDNRPIPDGNSIPIEQAYFLEASGFELPATFWDSAARSHLKKAAVSGCSLAEVYQLTHVIYFGTDFGERRFCEEIEPILIALVLASIPRAVEIENWDATAELGLALLCLSSRHYDVALSTITLLKEKQSSYGWVLSDGNRLPVYEARNSELTDRESYSLFHTTLVSCYFIAWVTCLHDPSAQQGAPADRLASASLRQDGG